MYIYFSLSIIFKNCNWNPRNSSKNWKPLLSVCLFTSLLSKHLMYFIHWSDFLDNLDLEFGPTESTRNSTSSTGATGTSTFSTGTSASSSSTASTDFTPTTLTGTQRSPSTSTPSPTPAIHENYLTLQDGLPHKNTYMAGEILFNVTLKYGIKAGKFNDKGKLGNMSECVRACGRMESCSLAFMLGKQCFAVSCYNDALCLTKPAYSPFYKPKIAFVKHTKVVVTGKWENTVERTSPRRLP